MSTRSDSQEEISGQVDRPPRFSIALVNYKSLEMTSICLDLLQKAVDVSEIPVWVVDNDSNDASLEYLRSIDWIKLIERKPPGEEVGFLAHGRALDMILEKVSTEYLLLLHTDTFIYDPAIIDIMLEKFSADDRVAAVGCMEPVLRKLPHTVWRTATRGTKYYFRRLKMALGLKTRPPTLYYEVYFKSFCALWNVNIIKSHGMSFSMGEKIPGYEMQDELPRLGYRFVRIAPREMFRYLDHIDKGTASAKDGIRLKRGKIRKYQNIVGKNLANR
ncbi:MAG: Glycosyl transferase family 2 [Candidatus Accumulibacter regalis]|uniref:Glycosyl transferase family 2 n=1 Tax=Accumulibacter regalis TaxID=522306 RepID=A0A011PTN5_ACCRE|nr:glycosyltransferase [Accumulibacter sp.]EXI90766.1 MAG: Glycosyl transferase family 2 [Candidatus Accumulibacter regalis]HRE69062.1 glycosyltransferase [Accumulibacter sp.]